MKEAKVRTVYREIKRILFIALLLVALVDTKNKTRYGCRGAEVCSRSVVFHSIEIIAFYVFLTVHIGCDCMFIRSWTYIAL
jgi:hypothetical protein